MADDVRQRSAPGGHGLTGLAPAIAGLYAWLTAVLFGSVLLDVLLARLVVAEGGAEPYPGASTARDLLLLLLAPTLLVGVAAMAAARRTPAAVVLLTLAVAFGLAELLVPALLAGPIDGLSDALGVALGPWLRVVGVAAASILALAGLWRVARTT